MLKIIIVFTIASLMFSCSSESKLKETLAFKEYSGEVKDSITAIKIAIANWYPVYGKKIFKNKPFVAKLKNGIWSVEGTLKNGWMGGVPYIKIDYNTGSILKMGHSK